MSKLEPQGKIYRWNPDQIQLAEFDLGGVLYHANYFRLFERARENFLDANATPYPELVKASQHLAVVESHQKFINPIRYGEDLSLNLWLDNVRQTSAVFHYEIWRNDDGEKTHVHQAWTKMAFLDMSDEGLKVTALPPNLRAAFKEFEKID